MWHISVISAASSSSIFLNSIWLSCASYKTCKFPPEPLWQQVSCSSLPFRTDLPPHTPPLPSSEQLTSWGSHSRAPWCQPGELTQTPALGFADGPALHGPTLLLGWLTINLFAVLILSYIPTKYRLHNNTILKMESQNFHRLICQKLSSNTLQNCPELKFYFLHYAVNFRYSNVFVHSWHSYLWNKLHLAWYYNFISNQ